MVSETGQRLGESAFAQGRRLTDDDRAVLTHWSRWGSDGYPIRKLGRKWTHPRTPALFDRKRDAIASWEVQIDILIVMAGLEAREQAVTC